MTNNSKIIKKVESILDLRTLSNFELLIETKNNVSRERQATMRVLDSLREIERRRLFAERGYESLHVFCVKELGFSDGGASRRIKSMRLTNEVVVAKIAIENGELSLSVAATLEYFFQNEKRINKKTYSIEEKIKLVKGLAGKSKTECERKLLELSPKAIPKQKKRVVSATQTELSFVVDNKVMDKFKRIKELLAFTNPSEAAFFEKLADMALKQLEPKPFDSKPLSQNGMKQKSSIAETLSTANDPSRTSPEKSALKSNSPGASSRHKPSRYIPVAIAKSVWVRDNGQCTFYDRHTKRRCQSRFGLEFDHIQPFAKSGPNTEQNLRLLCRTHNLLAASRAYGKYKMPHASS